MYLFLIGIIFLAMEIVVLASGEGSTFRAVAESCRQGLIKARVSRLIVSRPEAGARHQAKELGVECLVCDPKSFAHFADWDKALSQSIPQCDLVLLAGFLKQVGPLTLGQFGDRMINTHPSLLPKFGGPGMYGRRVHKAVLEAGERESGVSLHRVSPEYDEGQVLAQRALPIDPYLKVEDLEHQIKALEKELLVSWLVDGANRGQFF